MSRVLTWMEGRPRLARWIAPWKQATYAFQLTLERRLWLFLAVDALLVLGGSVNALVQGGKLDSILTGSVFQPVLLLFLPTLSGIVALERRSGSLDLALSARSTELYFLRRVVPVCGLLWLQGSVLLTFSYLETKGASHSLLFNPLTPSWLRALFQCLLLALFVGACALFWATRLRTSGGVLGGSLVTTLLFHSSLTASPLLSGAYGHGELVLGIPRPLWSWIGSMAVVVTATTILYLYARERLRRPETMLD